MWYPNKNAFTTPVYGPAAKAISWEELDLSSVVPVGKNYIAKLVFRIIGTGSGQISVRPKGNLSNAYSGSAAGGVSNANTYTSRSGSVEVVTDSDSVVEWYSSSASMSIAVYVVGYLDCTVVDPTVVGTPYYNITITDDPWPGEQVDLGGVSNDDTLFMLENLWDTGSIGLNVAYRAADDYTDLFNGSESSSEGGGLSLFYLIVSRGHAIMVPSDSSGKIQTRHDSVGRPTSQDGFVHAYINSSQDWIRSREKVFTDVNPSLTWSDLDLSSGLYSASYVVLRVERVSGGGSGDSILAFRMKGDTNEYYNLNPNSGGSQKIDPYPGTAAYVAVPCDSDGKIQWVGESVSYGYSITIMGYVPSEYPSPFTSYSNIFKFVLPPWLLRTEGVKFFGALSRVIDDHRDRLVAGVKLRFPGLYTLEGIDRIGNERRLRRGPAEDAEVFAARLLRWWEDHRTRGNAYALLEQMLAYLVDTLDPPYESISYLGVRHNVSVGGVITRDKITWGTDESGNWAQVWVFLYTTAATVTDAVLESYTAIVRDWLPGHVIGRVVVIHPDTRLWDYPQPVPDWDDTWDWADGPTIKDTREI